MSDKDERLSAYVETTGRVVAERLERDAKDGTIDVRTLAYDVAWLARQVSKIARMIGTDA